MNSPSTDSSDAHAELDAAKVPTHKATGEALSLPERVRVLAKMYALAGAMLDRKDAEGCKAPGCLCADIDASDRPCLVCEATASVRGEA